MLVDDVDELVEAVRVRAEMGTGRAGGTEGRAGGIGPSESESESSVRSITSMFLEAVVAAAGPVDEFV